MAICVQSHASGRKQTTILNGIYVGPPKWHVRECDINQSVHEGMYIPNLKAHTKTRSEYVNI